MTDEELDEMLDTADTKHDGLINYSGIHLSKIVFDVSWWIFWMIAEFVMLLSKDSKKSSNKGKNKKRTKKPHREAKTKDIASKSAEANANMNNLKTVRNPSR